MIQHLPVKVAQARLAPHEGSIAFANTTWCGAGTRLRYLNVSENVMQRIITQ